jgi:hypothetical protein
MLRKAIQRLALPLLLLCHVGCGYNLTWDLDLPFAPLAVDGAELPQAVAQAAFKSAIEQLGGRVVPGAPQQVHIAYDASCSCQTCTNLTIAHTERFSQDTIRVCPRWKLAPADTINDIVFHETGHVLGQWDHLPCENAMMSPRYDCRTDHGVYSVSRDIPWICAGNVGGVHGGKCD